MNPIRPPSRFTGVHSVRNGKWAARIRYKRSWWLGTYSTEEEAALVYDLAATKVSRGCTAYNFPRSLFTDQDTRFQAQHSVEEILEMIRTKTYMSNFTSYIWSESRRQDPGALIRVLNLPGISSQLLFHKELALADFTIGKEYFFPMDQAVEYFPPLARIILGEGDNSMLLTFYDRECCKCWVFSFFYWRSLETIVLTDGLRDFLVTNNLKPKDTVVFLRCQNGADVNKKAFYMIDISRHNENSTTGLTTGQGTDAINNNQNTDLANTEAGKEEGKTSGFMLFGVQIVEEDEGNNNFREALSAA